MKLKMQLSEDCPVSMDFRAEINAWMVDFFGYEEDAVPDKPKLNDANIITKRKEKRTHVKDLGALLENIGETFKNLEFDIDDVTFYRMLKREVVGLKKCSPLVTDKGFMGGEDWVLTVDPKKGLPSYFVVAVNQGDRDTKETLGADFAFGMRVSKQPWNVTKLQGVLYLFGMAWRAGKKHIWNGFWLSVLPDGSIQVAHELQPKIIQVAGGSYTKNAWEASTWRGPSDDPVKAIKSCFSETLSIYQSRKEKWNINVSNGNKQITFLIPDNEAKGYFKNREKVITTNGKTKPIIHFVREHTQNHNGRLVEIPEHIRGLREFDWAGYHCTITAPKFHAYSSVTMELDAELSLDDEPQTNRLEIFQVAEMLNQLENQGQKKIKKVGRK